MSIKSSSRKSREPSFWNTQASFSILLESRQLDMYKKETQKELSISYKKRLTKRT